jgi:cell division protein FtsI/penicillin-binding protein 2
MVVIRHTAILAVTLLAGALSAGDTRISAPISSRRPTLFAQSVAAKFEQKFADQDVSFLLLDAQNGELLASRWEDAAKPIALGSLVKPFTALAYGREHAFAFPVHTCRGTATGCWLPRGHGRMDLDSAIAYSCNSYFRVLTAELTADQVAPVAAHFGLEPPAPKISGPALAGLGNDWLISPLSMARAYLELVRRRDDPGVPQILAGMAESARKGTGAEVDRALPYPDALVKTGTAVCTHRPRAPGDGFAVVLLPEDQPVILLMVRVHGVPGAQAAKTAGKMLREIQP